MYTGPIIDFHTHFFPERLQQAIERWFTDRGWRFTYHGIWKDWIAFFDNQPRVEKYLAFGYAHKPDISRELNRFYADLLTHSPKAVALMTAHHDDADLRGVVRDGFAAGLRGVKLHHHVQKIRPDDRRLDPLYEEVIAADGFVMMHAGAAPYTNEYVGFEPFRRVPERFPELKCVIAHLGAPHAADFLQAALRHENLYLDTSYTFVPPVPAPVPTLDAPVELMLEAAEKVLFASDFPGLCHTYDDAVRVIEELGYGDQALAGVMYGNGARLLGLR